MGKHRKLIGIGVGVIAVIAIAFGAYYVHLRQRDREPFLTGGAERQKALTLGGKSDPGKGSPFIILPGLNDSDEWVRKNAKSLSTYGKLAEWLKINNLIRKITAAVDNIAEGKSPRRHLKFFAPAKPLTIIKRQETIYLNPQSYHRYDLVADFFASLDTGRAFRIFDELKPVFQDAYRELGYPNGDFQTTLTRAIKELLDTPTVEGDIVVEEGVTAYHINNDDLGDLSDAQMHLIRMGPQNTEKIQKKLREFATALGIPENQLPKPRVYQTKNHLPVSSH